MHVDNFLFAGTDDFNRSINDPIARKYKIGKTLIENFHYVGLNVSQDKNNAIQVNQNEYATEMQEITVTVSRKRFTKHSH